MISVYLLLDWNVLQVVEDLKERTNGKVHFFVWTRMNIII